jgi:hypothetical protein
VSHYSDGIKCSGRTITGGPCRRLTKGTVAGGHAACPAHEAQVKTREHELAARKGGRTRYESHAWSGGDSDECVACGVRWEDCEEDCPL